MTIAQILGSVADKFFAFLNSVLKIFNKDAEEVGRSPEIEGSLAEWWEIITTK